MTGQKRNIKEAVRDRETRTNLSPDEESGQGPFETSFYD